MSCQIAHNEGRRGMRGKEEGNQKYRACLNLNPARASLKIKFAWARLRLKRARASVSVTFPPKAISDLKSISDTLSR